MPDGARRDKGIGVPAVVDDRQSPWMAEVTGTAVETALMAELVSWTSCPLSGTSGLNAFDLHPAD